MIRFFQIFILFFVAVIASFFPYLAYIFFDTPSAHGIISWDVLLVLVLLCTPRSKFQWIPLSIIVFGFALWKDDLRTLIYALYAVLSVIVLTCLPRKRTLLVVAFVLTGFFSFIAECSLFFYNTFSLFLGDVWNLAKFFWWGVVLFAAVPTVVIGLQVLFARKILYGCERLEIKYRWVYLVAVICLAVNYGINLVQQRQPILQFAMFEATEQGVLPVLHDYAAGVHNKNVLLQEDAKMAFTQWPSQNVVENSNKPTLVILVESWGMNKNVEFTEKFLSPFAGASFAGVFLRNSSYTQGAEWEDFGTPSGKVTSTSLMMKFKNDGFETWYLHGYSGDFYDRQKNYPSLGFDSLMFKENLSVRGLGICEYGFAGICDSSMVEFIDSLMTDSVSKFIYWTTLDAHPPYEAANVKSLSDDCNEFALGYIPCVYFTLQMRTSRRIAALAAKHPEYRIVVRGDHRPMGASEKGFVASFYYRWVPMVVLNE